MKKLLAVIVMLVITVSIVACGKKKSEETTSLAKTTGAKLLTYVPADSPYVYAALESSPKDVTEKLQPMLDATIPALRSSLESVTGLMELQDGEAADQEAIEQRKKILNAVTSRMTPGLGKRFGFSVTESVAVLYGHGLLPVARIVLDDPDQFRSEFAAMLAEMELEFEQTKAGSITYDRIPIAEAGQLIIAQDADMLVVALAPAELGAADVEKLLGGKKPAESLADSVKLQALAEKYDYLAYGLGWIDMQAIAKVFLDGPTGMNKAIFDLAGPDAEMPELSDVCRSEIGSLAAVAPRLTIGYTKLDADGFEMLPVMELREDIASGMKPVAGNVPGLTEPTSSLMKFGMAIDLKALRGYIDQQIAVISESPFECPELAQLNMAAAQMEQALAQPIPPIAYNFKGFFLDINSLDGIDFSNPAVPEELDLSVLLAFDNVGALLQMGQMMMPPLAAIDLQPDGKAALIPQEMLAGYAAPVYAAMSDGLLAMGSGDGSESRVASMVNTDAEGEPVVLAMSVDLAKYTRLMNEMQSSVMADLENADGDAQSAQAQALLETTLENNRKLQEIYSEIFDRETIRIVITDNGFELATSITFQ